MAPMTRRRSARLASNSKTPGGAAAPGLDSLAEQPEDHGHDHPQPPCTPASSSPVKPPMSEMHPNKANAPKPTPSSALRLGFADIQSSATRRTPTTTRGQRGQKGHMSPADPETTAAVLQATPSKIVPGSPPFTFRFSRPGGLSAATASPRPEGGSGTKLPNGAELGLSKEARRMMEELREEAMKIRADLELQRQQEAAALEAENGTNGGGRRIAQAKRRGGRFSAAHTAEFSKMDSIANHPSAFRASRVSPTKATATTPAAAPASTSQMRGLKRTQSKANLDDTPNSKRANAPAAAASALAETTASFPSSAKKRYNPLFASASKTDSLASAERPQSTAKRMKQNWGDDTSTGRPMSRDGNSLLPRFAPSAASAAVAAAASSSATGSGNKQGPVGSASGLTRSHTTASLLTPTKASLARTAMTAGTQTPSKTPSQPVSALKKSATTGNLHGGSTPGASKTAKPQKDAGTETSSIRKVLFGSQRAHAAASGAAGISANAGVARSALPVPTITTVMPISKTPAPARVIRPLPRFPATTPRRQPVKHVTFTPTTQRAILAEQSPSLFRSGIPRSGTIRRVEPEDDAAVATVAGRGSPGVRRLADGGGRIQYPDLSGHELLGGGSPLAKRAAATSEAGKATAATGATKSTAAPLPSSVPGTFTFRSDKTIRFGETSPTGFGASPGQASVRQVRASTAGIPKIPGSFPGGSSASDLFTALVATDGPNKENAQPVVVGNIAHGIANKKRHRVSEAEEEADREASERAAKKRKNEPVAEGDALLAPRLVGKTGSSSSVGRTPYKPQPLQPMSSSAKKRPILSLSRLSALARPKLRK